MVSQIHGPSSQAQFRGQIHRPDKRAGLGDRRWASGTAVLILLLTLSYVLAPASPSSASVFNSDTSPDQSTGPTDPTGPPH